MSRIRFLWIVLGAGVLLVLLLLSAGCQREEPASSAAGSKSDRPIRAVAELLPTKGSEVSGTVSFLARNGEVEVVADLKGLKPGRHGFHIHERGDCSAADATSAGGHFNPAGTPHGAPTDPGERRHVGDLGNIEADADGRAHLEMADPVIALEGEHSIIGKAVIVHARADDLTTQSTGDAGPRQACGVIEVQREP